MVSLYGASIAAVLLCLTENMVLYHPIGQIKAWKTELWGIPNRWGGINIKVYLPDLTISSCPLLPNASPSQVNGSKALTFCSWNEKHLFCYCRSHLSCYASVLYSLWSTNCLRVIFKAQASCQSGFQRKVFHTAWSKTSKWNLISKWIIMKKEVSCQASD